MNKDGKGKEFFKRLTLKEPVCRCGYIRRKELRYGKCPLKGKDGNCYLKIGKYCKYAKKFREGKQFSAWGKD